jgi:uncharacterized protein YgbK (DUF1537 family)
VCARAQNSRNDGIDERRDKSARVAKTMPSDNKTGLEIVCREPRAGLMTIICYGGATSVRVLERFIIISVRIKKESQANPKLSVEFDPNP